MHDTRDRMYFYDNVRQSMELVGRQCVQCGTTEKLEIDHMKSASQLLSQTPQVEVHHQTEDSEPGGWHWWVTLQEDATYAYNAYIDQEEPASEDLVEGRFQWLCSTHNASKSGMKGIDSPGPKYIGPCDGDSCTCRILTRA